MTDPFTMFGNAVISTAMAIKNFTVNFAKFSWITRPFRALFIAYGYVLRGEKVQQPLNYNDI